MTAPTDTRRCQYIVIRHVSTSPSGKTHTWRVLHRAHGYGLGLIVYRPGWRQYVFQPNEVTEYSAGCLDDISAFMKEMRL